MVATVLADAEHGARLVAPLREVAPPFLDTFAQIPAAALGDIAGDPVDPVPAMGGHALLGSLGPEAIEAILRLAGPGVDSPLLQVEVRQLGGAFAVAGPDDGALTGVQAPFSLYAVGIVMGPEHAEVVAGAIAALGEAVSGWATGRRLFNFADGDVDSRELYDKAVHDRLARIRLRHDPDGLLRPNHPIAAR